MLRVNLNMLLAERGITASRLSKDTGISKTTLTALVNNRGKGVQYETIDTICNYLNITPDDFFEYLPIDYSITIFTDEIKVSPKANSYYEINDFDILYKIDLFIDVKTQKFKKTFEFIGELVENEGLYEVEIEIRDPFEFEEFVSIFYLKLSESFKLKFNQKVDNIILDTLYEDIRDKVDELREHTPHIEDTQLEYFLENSISINVTKDWE